MYLDYAVSGTGGTVNKLKYIFDRIELGIAWFFFCTMSIAVGLQLIARFTKVSFVFTEEVARYSYIWVAFLCMSLAEKQRAHFNVTVFTIYLKGRAEAALEFFADLVCTMVFIYLFYWSLKFWPFTHVLKTPSLEIPMTVVSTCLCVSFFLSSIHRLFHAISHAKQMIKGGKP